MARNPCVSLQRISVIEQMVSVDHRILAQGAGCDPQFGKTAINSVYQLNDILAPPNLVMAAQEFVNFSLNLYMDQTNDPRKSSTGNERKLCWLQPFCGFRLSF
jgi:hypothetical protein